MKSPPGRNSVTLSGGYVVLLNVRTANGKGYMEFL